VAGIEK